MHPAGSWWVATFHSHASFLPRDEMCMEVSVRIQLTGAAVLSCTRAVAPCSLSRDKHWIYSTQVRQIWHNFLNIVLLGDITVLIWMDNDWSVVISCTLPATWRWKSWSHTLTICGCEWPTWMWAGNINQETASHSAYRNARFNKCRT